MKMSAENDAYYDEDAVVVDAADIIAAASMEEPEEPAFMKAFRQVGDTLRNGGFCKNNPSDEENSQMLEKKVEIESTPAAKDLDSDDDSEEKSRSVTFRDLAEPLIVPEEDEEDSAPAAESKTKAETTSTTQVESKISPKAKSSFLTISLGVVVVAAVTAASVLIAIIMESDAPKNVEGILSTAKVAVTDYVQVNYSAIAAMDFDVAEYAKVVEHITTECMGCPVTAGLVVAATALLSTKIISATMKLKLARMFELAWGTSVCLLIAAGIYHTYK